MRKFFIAVIGAVAMTALVAIYLRCNFIYLPGTTVNGVDVSFKSKEEVWNEILSDLPTTLLVEFEGEIIPLNVLSYEEPIELTTSVRDYFTCAPIVYEAVPDIAVGFIAQLDEANATNASDAYIYTDESMQWQIAEETYGYDIPIDDVIKSIYDGEYKIDLDQYRVRPEVTVDDLKDTYESLVWMNDFKITYTDGTTLSGVDLVDMTDKKKFLFELDNEYLDNFLKSLEDSYDTRLDVYEFKPTLQDEVISIPRGKWSTFGKQLNKTKEREWLIAQIDNRESVTDREPYLYGYDELGDTYIEVSINDQHLWYYVDGELKSETDIVTGHRDKHDTPTGVYYMSECLRNKTLRGDGYSSFVSYWMRLTNSGIGLHDATWRNKFGDAIYTYNGSHGCINLPYSFAKELFDDAYLGMPVVIY